MPYSLRFLFCTLNTASSIATFMNCPTLHLMTEPTVLANYALFHAHTRSSFVHCNLINVVKDYRSIILYFE